MAKEIEEKPKFKDTKCPRCDEEDVVEMYNSDMRIVWCASGHVSIKEAGYEWFFVPDFGTSA